MILTGTWRLGDYVVGLFLMRQRHIIRCDSQVMDEGPSSYMMVPVVPEVTGKPGDNLEVKVDILMHGAIYFITGRPVGREGVGVMGGWRPSRLR